MEGHRTFHPALKARVINQEKGLFTIHFFDNPTFGASDYNLPRGAFSLTTSNFHIK